MTKRRIIPIVVLCSVFVLGCILYFALIKPIVTNTEEEKKLPPETQEGETIGNNDRYQIFEQISRDTLQTLTVTNEHGTYEFYRDNNGEFQIRGSEGVTFDVDTFTEVVTLAGYPLATMKVAPNADEYEQYGLNDPVASWTITSTAGKSYTMHIGHQLLTGEGYYACMEGRDAVYVVANAIKGTILSPVETFVTPIIMAAATNNDYYTIDDFTILRDDEPFVSFSLVDEKDKSNPDALAENIVTYPANYHPNSTNVWTTYQLMSGLVGEEAVVLGADDDDYEKFGLLEPAYTISFMYDNNPYIIFFSELGSDGYYYASSSINPTVISKISEEEVEFLSYDLFKWISVYPFEHYITQISELSYDTGERQASFTLEHFDDGTGNGGLLVDCSDGTDFSAEDMVQNFRMYYKELISLEMIDYANIAEEDREDVVSEENEMYSFSFKTLTGKKTTIAFYPYSTRRCLVTINGKGEFYVIIDRIEKVLSDTEKLMSGETIVNYAKS